MNSNALYQFPMPKNEPVKSYAPASEERKLLKLELKAQSSEVIEIPLIIGGKEIRTGKISQVVMPHDHKHILANYHQCSEKEIKLAIDSALKAKESWSKVSWVERASILLKAADLIATKYRYKINAATMLGQSKNAFQAEIDSACELIDFLRFNAHFASRIYSEQPMSEAGVLNRMEYRSLEGFVLAITPFNFTAIASNLNLSPVLMGNTTVWKPSNTALLSNFYLMKILQEAGLPDGVVNFVPGSGKLIGDLCTAHPKFAGVHFTGSTTVFNGLWKSIVTNLDKYVSYPKIVGETGGKDFVFAHTSADVDALTTALIRGSFEFQGQKCSAASRAYIPNSLWSKVKKQMGTMLSDMKVGDVSDFSNYINAVIDETSFDNCIKYIDYAKKAKDADIIFGGKGDKKKGYFISPTVILTSNPHFKSMEEEIFGPILTIYVYPDKEYAKTLDLCNNTSPYALTGAIFAQDRSALELAYDKLRFAA
ncbi:MAG: L-glutamate gamma-semialdehyde dehydrogenase, partial [Bacteroidales bacterium]